MQTYFSFYNKDAEIAKYTHLDYLKDYLVDDLLKVEFCKGLLTDFVSDKDLVLNGNYPQYEIANEIQFAIDYLLKLHSILKTWLRLHTAQMKLINSNRY